MDLFVLASEAESEASINAFVVAGAILAIWAVIVALLGMRGFPRNRAGERIAIGITAVLFAGAVTSAVADQSKVGERRGPEIDKPGEGPEGEKPGAPSDGQGGGGEAAAGGEGEPGPKDEGEQKGESGRPSALTLSADPSGATKFDKTALTANAGQITITMTNPSPVPHNVALRGNGVDEKGDVVQGDGKSTVEATLEPGLSYQFYCSVPGHEQGGMKGTLTVK
jgi:plastocyanin